jgi:hypothetical protein
MRMASWFYPSEREFGALWDLVWWSAMEFMKGEYSDKKANIERYIENEFSCYYLADELPEWNEENIEKVIPEMAAESAERLLTRIDKSQIEDMVSVLSDLRDNREQPLLKKIIEGTLMGWDGAEKDWRVFQIIIDGIIANLEKQR